MLKTDRQYENLMAEIRGLREEVGRIDRDLSRDREDLEDFKVEMATMKEEIKQVRLGLNANADKVKDKVGDALQPARHEMAKLTQEIKKKKTLIITKSGIVDWIKSKFGGGKQ
jgi:chromosome segregation ATPase